MTSSGRKCGGARADTSNGIQRNRCLTCHHSYECAFSIGFLQAGVPISAEGGGIKRKGQLAGEACRSRCELRSLGTRPKGRRRREGGGPVRSVIVPSQGDWRCRLRHWGGRGAIQMPSWSQMRLVGTKCCRRLETKSFIHCDSRCSSKKKQRLRGPLLGRVRTPCSSSNLARRGFLCGMDTLQIMTDFEGRVVAVGRQVL